METQNSNSFDILNWLVESQGWELLWPGMAQCDRYLKPLLRYNAAANGVEIQGYTTACINTRDDIQQLMKLLQIEPQ